MSLRVKYTGLNYPIQTTTISVSEQECYSADYNDHVAPSSPSPPPPPAQDKDLTKWYGAISLNSAMIWTKRREW